MCAALLLPIALLDKGLLSLAVGIGTGLETNHMHGVGAALPQTITVTLLEDGWIQTPLERRLMAENRLDEETREYLREKSLVESMTARRLFAHDDF
jgi:hypothetical protein